MGSEPKMPAAVHADETNCPWNVYTAVDVEHLHAAWQAYAAGIRAEVLGEVVTKLVQSGQPLAAATITTLEQQP